MEIKLEYYDGFTGESHRLYPGTIRRQLHNLLEAAGPDGAQRLLDAIRDGRVNGIVGYIADGCGCAIAHLFDIHAWDDLQIENYRVYAANPQRDVTESRKIDSMVTLEKFISDVREGHYPETNAELAWLEAETRAWLQEA
jgi:hypothetical protein